MQEDRTDVDPEELALLRSTVRQMFTGPHTLATVGELGYLGLLVPESAGGLGWRVVEACAFAGEAGRALTPVPWLGSTLAAAALARSAGHEMLVARLLAGEMAGAVASAADVRHDPDGGTVTGELTVVGDPATGPLVLLGDPSLHVDLAGPGVRVAPLDDPLDTTRQALRVRLDAAPATELPAHGGTGAAAALLACADSLGALEGTAERLVDYLSHRHAFGRPIASFQAVQHRLAELTVLISAGGALVRRAAEALAAGEPGAGRLVAAAHVAVARRATAALDDCVQLAGGIGFTWEWPTHQAMRRSVRNAALAPPADDALVAGAGSAAAEPAERSAFRARVREVIATHRPYEAREGHRAPVGPQRERALRQWYRVLYEEGLLGANWPPEWGGRADHEPWHQLVVTEELIRARAPRPIDQVLLASHVLLAFGTAEQKARYLPRIRTGQDIWCQLFSEPGAGSDLAGITARATRRDDGTWLLSGQKTWTTDGHWAQMGLALLRTSPGATRHAGMTAFLVPMDSPGLAVRPMRTIGGAHEFNDVFLDGVVLGPEHVVGEVDRGWAVAMSGLEGERYTMGGNVVLLELLLDDVRTVAEALGALRRGDVRAEVARLTAESEAAKAYIVAHADRAGSATGDQADAPMAKILYSETYNRIARFGTELAESRGAVPEEAAAAARRLRDAWLWSRAQTISGGSSEVMRNIIARRRLKLPSA